jgi:hypothetical protein
VRINQLPLAGVFASFALFGAATFLYPGGYDWLEHYISTLFAPMTGAGEANRARSVAVLAMFVLCLSVAVAFKLVSRRASGRLLAKTLEIGGIGSMVYAFFAVTVMHDLVIAIALVFIVPAILAALGLASMERRRVLFWSGLACFGLLLAGVTMYYGSVLRSLLPMTQKAIFVTSAAWVLMLQRASPPLKPTMPSLTGG